MEQLRIHKALPARFASGPGLAPGALRCARAALPRRCGRSQGQCGSVAIGMAVVLPLLLFSLAVPLFLARAFWYYSVAHKAALDAARYLATASQAQMHPSAGEGRESRAAAGARWLAESGTAALRAAANRRAIQVQCGTTRAGGAVLYGDCGRAVPDTVRVHIGLSLRDELFPGMRFAYFKPESLYMTTVVTMRYAGSQGGGDAIVPACC